MADLLIKVRNHFGDDNCDTDPQVIDISSLDS